MPRFHRKLGNGTLADNAVTRPIAEMALAIDASALLIYRAAWQQDRHQETTAAPRDGKLHATESAQRVIDINCNTGLGVTATSGQKLYRDIRALRIYEGRARSNARSSPRPAKEAAK